MLAQMGMGIQIRRTAVSCPAGMTNTDVTRKASISFYSLTQVNQAAHFFLYIKGAIMIHGNTCRVIASVFEFCQAFQQEISSLTITYISNNTTHIYILL